MNKNGVTDFLLSHSKKKPVSFHMPGHKGSEIYRENGFGDFLDCIMDCDVTEIPGADNLFQPEDIIKNTMDKYKRIYESRSSYILINGSSAGLIAAIMTCVGDGGKLVMARNCHKSIYNGLILAGGQPVYAYPETIEDYQITGEVTLETIKKCFTDNPDATACLIPSPNYYGVCSDIKGIADYLHSIDKILIVDQAHGAHLKLFDKYIGERTLSAENGGADIVINSTHKTLASYTQSAVVNICSDRVDRYEFEDKLQLIESTSPSYILMASMDINAQLIIDKGEQLIKRWAENIEFFYERTKCIKGLKVMTHPMLDYTKINLDMGQLGINGLELEHLLMERNIFVELVTGNIVMAMTGIGNKRCDFEILADALEEIAFGKELILQNCEGSQRLTQKKLEQRPIPKLKEYILLEDGARRVCAAAIIPYPPGIPIVCPGEIIDDDILEYVKELKSKGQKVMGIDDLGRIVVEKK